MTLLDDFMIRAALAGLGVAIAAAPLGCFVVWRRMAYFGDATAHASILGVALALSFDVSIFAGVLATALVMASTISFLSGRGYAMDTLLGVLAHSALAFGLVAVSFLHGVRVDLMAYLFGDILAVSRGDLAVIWTGAALILPLLWWRWSSLLTATLNPELARASGIAPQREQMVLIPAATARVFSNTPERMALLAGVVGCASVLIGMFVSFQMDTPTGPTIVSAGTVFFVCSSLLTLIGAARRR
ncbi:metal ABC transporter permease [Phaeobacter sp. HF9A]|uniref:metal ABC transporter permease n=1 Tax=Phaeobacter sp. HF9A TaxID=2721561 RepID=UPI0014306076|nr:metal ABC transporter permease [Phaeobacter sp. HF9A]NIZ14311.1 hypothetical protein [Phaeobacter sp. HF9A]